MNSVARSTTGSTILSEKLARVRMRIGMREAEILGSAPRRS
jgi:hypothetical protein